MAIYWLTKSKPLRAGKYAAIFLLGYALARFSLEFVRKPDDQFYEGGSDGTVLMGMTMGQTLTVGMVIGALLILCWPRKSASGSPASSS